MPTPSRSVILARFDPGPMVPCHTTSLALPHSQHSNIHSADLQSLCVLRAQASDRLAVCSILFASCRSQLIRSLALDGVYGVVLVLLRGLLGQEGLPFRLAPRSRPCTETRGDREAARDKEAQ